MPNKSHNKTVRINIESQWWTDPRREKLARELGSTMTADGAWIQSIRLAQSYYPDSIPQEIWMISGLPTGALLSALLISKSDNGDVCVRGATTHFQWIEKLRKNAKKGGLKKAEIERQKKLNTQTELDMSAIAKPEVSQILPSYSYSSSFSKRKEEEIENKTLSAEPTHPLAELWNTENQDGKLPRVRSLTKARLKHSRNRWKEKPDLEYWRQVIAKLRGSSFCTGKNDRGWKANYDFLVRPDTHVKALEGLYSGKQVAAAAAAPAAAPEPVDWAKVAADLRSGNL